MGTGSSQFPCPGGKGPGSSGRLDVQRCSSEELGDSKENPPFVLQGAGSSVLLSCTTEVWCTSASELWFSFLIGSVSYREIKYCSWEHKVLRMEGRGMEDGGGEGDTSEPISE